MGESNGDEMLTTTQAGVLLATLKHRAKPYRAATVAKWIREDALDAEMDDGGRYLIKKSELVEWAKDGDLLPADVDPSKPVATNPSSQRRVTVPDKAAADEAGEEDEDGADVDEGDLEDDDIEIAQCPECGADVPVTTATITAVCPSCGEVLEVVEEDGDEGDDDEGDEEEKGELPVNPFRLSR